LSLLPSNFLGLATELVLVDHSPLEGGCDEDRVLHLGLYVDELADIQVLVQIVKHADHRTSLPTSTLEGTTLLEKKRLMVLIKRLIERTERALQAIGMQTSGSRKTADDAAVEAWNSACISILRNYLM